MLLIMPVNQKMSDMLAFDFNALLSDRSLEMRIYNIENYLDWLNNKRILFGGGAQSFLEFSSQYSMPGPLDMGYVRLISEFGIVGILSLIILLVLIFKNKLVYFKNKIYFRFFIFLLIYTILNEGIFAGKSGNLTFFMLGYFFFKFRNE
jgi:O-antigen ligase